MGHRIPKLTNHSAKESSSDNKSFLDRDQCYSQIILKNSLYRIRKEQKSETVGFFSQSIFLSKQNTLDIQLITLNP